MTTYLLAEIDGKDYPVLDLKEKFVDGYVINQKAVERRLEEQRAIGLVVGGEKIKLTRGGQVILRIMRWIKRIYRIG